MSSARGRNARAPAPRGAPGRVRIGFRNGRYWSLKETVTVIWTFTGFPFFVAGL